MTSVLQALDEALPTELAELLRSVDRHGDFYASGTVELAPPSLEVDGVGPISLPLLPVQAEQLLAVADVAPFGRGQKTVRDPTVRRCWQVGPERARMGGRHWGKTLEQIVARVAEGLAIAEPITATFYKLLIYNEGSFFVSHRDTEKAPGMFATLVIVLPSTFSGGALHLRHGEREVSLDLRSTDPAEAAFAAFYADCVHEIRPVTAGYRLALTYNLTRARSGRAPQPPNYKHEQGQIGALLQAWRDAPAEAHLPAKLVYPLEHAYTPAELGFAALKGRDAAVAGVLADAAASSNCDLALALLTIEESGAAEYSGSYNPRRWRSRDDDDDDAFEAGEVFDRSVTLSEWRRPDGVASQLGSIPVHDAEFSPPDAVADLTPDEQHFREATGNEGASFERTYQRAVLVLWPRKRYYAVLSQAGQETTLPLLEELVQTWTEAGAVPQSASWQEAHDLAGHILARWSGNTRPSYGNKVSQTGTVLDLLTRLDDTALITSFLTDSNVLEASTPADIDAVIRALACLPAKQRATLITRMITSRAKRALEPCAIFIGRAATSWPEIDLKQAADVLIAALPGDPARVEPELRWQAIRTVAPEVVVHLLKGLGAIDSTRALTAAKYFLAWPTMYDMDGVIVPALRTLLSDDAKGPGSARAIDHLRARTAPELTAPKDWRRDNALSCKCKHCSEFGQFLADSGQKIWALRAVEHERSHVEESIKRARCDVDVITDRRGRPYTLICTKNTASFDRAMKQRVQDMADLKRLTA
jgi:predicted 2-oxoglutarate/Fe(II)-dependent dioxygenase YbiX